MRRHNKYSAGLGRFGFCQMMLSAGLLVGWSASAQASIWLDGNVATMQALDKITARISTLAAPVGEPRRFGTLEVTVQRCVFHPPEETPENAAFVVIRDLGYDPSAPPIDVFSGWMFYSSPAISALEHPVYDITILACSPD
jgi:hypothetical protein